MDNGELRYRALRDYLISALCAVHSFSHFQLCLLCIGYHRSNSSSVKTGFPALPPSAAYCRHSRLRRHSWSFFETEPARFAAERLDQIVDLLAGIERQAAGCHNGLSGEQVALCGLFTDEVDAVCAQLSMSVCDCGSSRQAAMLSAVVCPMSRISVISSTGAVSSASSEPKWSLRMRPAFWPTCRMPNANSSRDRSRVLLASIERTRLFAQTSTFLPSGSSCSTVQVVQVSRRLDQSGVDQLLQVALAAAVDVHRVTRRKVHQVAQRCAGHGALVQRIAASSSSSYTGAPHTGQNFRELIRHGNPAGAGPFPRR